MPDVSRGLSAGDAAEAYARSYGRLALDVADEHKAAVGGGTELGVRHRQRGGTWHSQVPAGPGPVYTSTEGGMGPAPSWPAA